jgi:type III secretion system FlhB-like substrate exporter
MAPLLTNAGKDILTNRIIAAGTEPKFVAMGTGATAEAITQTALVTEVETRATGTSSRVTTTTTNDTYQVVGTITATTTRAIQESGLFDASTVGNMLTRGVFTTVNLSSGDSIQFTWKLQFS